MDINTNPRTPNLNVDSTPRAMRLVAKFFSFREPPPVIISTLKVGDGGDQPVHTSMSDQLAHFILLAKNFLTTVLWQYVFP